MTIVGTGCTSRSPVVVLSTTDTCVGHVGGCFETWPLFIDQITLCLALQMGVYSKIDGLLRRCGYCSVYSSARNHSKRLWTLETIRTIFLICSPQNACERGAHGKAWKKHIWKFRSKNNKSRSASKKKRRPRLLKRRVSRSGKSNLDLTLLLTLNCFLVTFSSINTFCRSGNVLLPLFYYNVSWHWAFILLFLLLNMWLITSSRKTKPIIAFRHV